MPKIIKHLCTLSSVAEYQLPKIVEKAGHASSIPAECIKLREFIHFNHNSVEVTVEQSSACTAECIL